MKILCFKEISQKVPEKSGRPFKLVFNLKLILLDINVSYSHKNMILNLNHNIIIQNSHTSFHCKLQNTNYLI
jgi:hypothetical protein